MTSNPTSPSDLAVAAFAQAAAAGCVLELKYRMLAEMRPHLRPLGRAKLLLDVETAIIEEYRTDLLDADVLLLGQTRVLRNKVLHCDFDVAHEKLREMGIKLMDGLVTMVNMETGDAKPLIIGEKGAIYGWLVQSAQNGLFMQAALKFGTAIALVNRLLSLG